MRAADLHVEEAGEGRPVVLLHGLTATHRYVVMGSRALERGGHRVIAYDARGHGASAAAPEGEGYGYDRLAADLVAVLDRCGVERAVLAGASMGAHTLLRVALEHPQRVAGIVVITPAYLPEELEDTERLARWDALSEGLRSGGVDGFMAAYGDPGVPEAWRETVLTVMRQRLERHEHPAALADALREVPRSAPFSGLEALEGLDLPAIVVADRDEADPGHPLATGRAYADAIAGARLVVEDEGTSPIAWSGGRLSALIAEVASEAGT